MCGGITFAAARSSSTSFKKLDETGVIMSCCRHGMVFKALDMYKGETFIDTHLMHNNCKLLNCKFFCNDVICRYWKWAKKVSHTFPKFKNLTDDMEGFLPRMHAKAHDWPCQVCHLKNSQS